MQFTGQQDAAIKAVRAWLRGSDQVFYLAGFAGTGKTTLALELVRDRKPMFAAFTGKAALQMAKKGCIGASTIHSAIYKADERDHRDEDDRADAAPRRDRSDAIFTFDPSARALAADIVVIDECSMVGEELGRDLLKLGHKVLVIGDPAQLPPVSGEGFFTSRTPDFMLTEIHRQARDNPIIRMSMDVREGNRLTAGEYGDSIVFSRKELMSRDVLACDQAIVGTNKSRLHYNARIRDLKGLDPAGPVKGDKLICLRNDKRKKIFNGGIFHLEKWKRDDGIYHLTVKSEDEPDRDLFKVKVPEEHFTGEKPPPYRHGRQEMTFGYAITCHKSQGSQWPHVFILNEMYAFGDDKAKWLYTAITRASERVTVAL